MDAFLIVLPDLLFNSIEALPLALGTVAAICHLWAGSRSAYFQNLAASMAAGAVTLALLWSSLFDDNLMRSSTAGLIFAVAPIYAAIAQGVVYGMVTPIFRKATMPKAISPFAWLAMLVPLLMLTVLLFGLVKNSFEGSDSTFAEQASDPQTLHRLLEKSRTGAADPFAIPFNLAQNRNAPPDILSELAKSAYATVRAHVADNPNTPPQVVATLRYDCASFVRKAVVERLGPVTAPQPEPAPTGVCPPQWRR